MLDLNTLDALGFESPRIFWTMDRRDPPTFLPTSTAGTYRSDPSRPVSELHQKWVHGTPIMYVGAAGIEEGNKTTLRKRLSAYQRYGHGNNGVSHEGGNRIWQLADVKQLQVRWKPTPDVPGKRLEDELLALFEQVHDRLPFANGRH